MRIGVQTAGIEQFYGVDGTYRLIAESGFDAADANIDSIVPYLDVLDKKIPAVFFENSTEYLKLFKPYRDAAEKYGIGNDQAHAPFPSSLWCPDDPDFNKRMLEALQKFVVGCDYINCHKLVIHPFDVPYEQYVSREQEFEKNLKCYSSFIENAKKYGVTICLENCLLHKEEKIMLGVGSDIAESCSLIDELNRLAGANVFGFCLDIGHMLIMGLDVRRVMEDLGSRLAAVHIHDNNGLEDQHLAPYMGIMDWQRFIDGMKAVRFSGTLSFETLSIWRRIDRNLCPEFMKFIAKTGRYFSDCIEGKL